MQELYPLYISSPRGTLKTLQEGDIFFVDFPNTILLFFYCESTIFPRKNTSNYKYVPQLYLEGRTVSEFLLKSRPSLKSSWAYQPPETNLLMAEGPPEESQLQVSSLVINFFSSFFLVILSCAQWTQLRNYYLSTEKPEIPAVIYKYNK